MLINVSIRSEEPLYEQIKNQIIELIISKKLVADQKLPSIRVLAKELQVGIITVKRAYDDLILSGYIISKEAIGYYVNDISVKKVKDEAIIKLKHQLKDLIEQSVKYGISQTEIKHILEELSNE